MKLINKTKNNLMHILNGETYLLKVGEKLEVPKEIGEKWLKLDGIEEYVSPQDLEKAKEKAVKEALEKEKEKLRKEIEAELKGKDKKAKDKKENKKDE